jgi:hypothetical protein
MVVGGCASSAKSTLESVIKRKTDSYLSKSVTFMGGYRGNNLTMASSHRTLLPTGLQHFFVFGIFAFLVWKALNPYRFAYLGAWRYAVVYAATDEWHRDGRDLCLMF